MFISMSSSISNDLWYLNYCSSIIPRIVFIVEIKLQSSGTGSDRVRDYIIRNYTLRVSSRDMLLASNLDNEIVGKMC